MRGIFQRAIAIIIIQTLALPYPLAHAVLNQSTNALSVDANKAQPAQLSCNDGGLNSVKSFCEGLQAPVDPQWCANHGSPTEAAVGPSPNLVRAPANSCNVPMLEGENCTDVNQMLLKCKYKNSQVESQCMAYMKADEVGPLEYSVLGLDMAAAGICGTVCAATYTGVGASLGFACSAAGCAASLGQLAAVIKSTESPVSKIMQGLMTGVGALTAYKSSAGVCGIGGAKNEVEKHEMLLSLLLIQKAHAEDVIQTSEGFFGKAPPTPDEVLNSNYVPTQPNAFSPNSFGVNGTNFNDMSNSNQIPSHSFNTDVSVRNPVGDRLQVGQDTKIDANFKEGQTDSKISDQQKMACVSAAMFAILAGLRYKNINSLTKTKDDACKSVQKLASNAAVAGPAQSDVNATNAFATNGTSITGGRFGSGGSGGSSVGSGIASFSTATQTGLQCVQQQGLNNCAIGGASTAGATDAQILGQSGLDRFASPIAQKLNFDDLKKQIEKGSATAGGLMAGAMGGASGAAGEFGKGLATLAQATFDNSKIFDSIGQGVGTAYASGGGGGGRSPASDGGMAAALGSMFGGGDHGSAAAQAAAAFSNFAQPQQDIWHAGSPMNIFQIVSDKIEKVHHRVK